MLTFESLNINFILQFDLHINFGFKYYLQNAHCNLCCRYYFQVRAKKMTSFKKLDSPRGEVGEIDTRAPFQSVKDAVSLFGEVAVSKDRFSVKRRSSEVNIKCDFSYEKK